MGGYGQLTILVWMVRVRALVWMVRVRGLVWMVRVRVSGLGIVCQ